MSRIIKLYEVAHSRAGDKGNISNLSLIPFDEADYEWIGREVTAEKVKTFLKDIIDGEVIRYDVPSIKSYNFVCTNSLLGGVTTSLAIDTHGKSLSSALLELDIQLCSKD
ncbi:AtuA-related protein [Sutcliffiella rhizosphaerae]|uniref:AtuA-like ferredoxin-fold domain-containing protein n=1 Tax=Sutcliffiella rhizosphaerae TaxID=2880967 RepID=A0ABM8YSP4_9BACI|nr:hypothetical protein [Sutcliffiella rhizosphaerae]CAG9623035.1 hypothetical protein BACCIP111883_03830 [Sutcliffiella rhizosphaerae]